MYWLYILIALVIPVLAARKRRSRRNRNFVAIPFQQTVAMSTLADGSVLTLNLLGTAFTEDLYVMSVDMASSVDGLTAGEALPSDLGIAHSDYDVTQIKENLDVVLLGPGNKIEQERTRRLIRKTGVMNEFDSASQTNLTMKGAGGSSIIRTKCKFVAESGKGLDAWIQNRSGAALTTGAQWSISGTIYGRWMI